MKKFLIALAFITVLTMQPVPAKITAVFVDVTALFETNSWRASGYVGKIAALKYAAQVGHTPSQADLFAQLTPMKAKSTQVTYNQNLEMPLIFSDWLSTIENNIKLKDAIQKYLNNKNISDIEKTVLFAIVSMMLTPQHLADTQDVNTKVQKVLETLKSKGIKVYLTGNWAHIASLKSEFPDLFTLFSGVFVSGDLHILKPSQEFYQAVLNKSKINAENALWIETESKFLTAAKKYNLNAIQYNLSANINTLITALSQYGLKA